MSVIDIRAALRKHASRKHASRKRAAISRRFFKTGPGEYGEGDEFIGVTVPAIRKVAKAYRHVSLIKVKTLLKSKIHEERLLALLILVEQYRHGTGEKAKIFDLYLTHTRFINNWDLVDLSADKIVGNHLERRGKQLLYRLARSNSLWERRIAMMATFHFIKQDRFTHALKIATVLLHDEHDLIHKAVGWMLREIGKRNHAAEVAFLKKHYREMPRTMLRYAIERFPEHQRRRYLKGTI